MRWLVTIYEVLGYIVMGTLLDCMGYPDRKYRLLEKNLFDTAVNYIH